MHTEGKYLSYGKMWKGKKERKKRIKNILEGLRPLFWQKEKHYSWRQEYGQWFLQTETCPCSRWKWVWIDCPRIQQEIIEDGEWERRNCMLRCNFSSMQHCSLLTLKTFYVSGGCQCISGFFQIYNTCTPIIPGQHMEILQFLLDRSFENILSPKTFTAGLWQSFVCNFHVSPLQDLINSLDFLTRLKRHIIPSINFKRFSDPKINK